MSISEKKPRAQHKYRPKPDDHTPSVQPDLDSRASAYQSHEHVQHVVGGTESDEDQGHRRIKRRGDPGDSMHDVTIPDLAPYDEYCNQGV